MEINNIGLVMEYEDILLKKRDSFSQIFLNSKLSKSDLRELFKYAFEEVLQWDVKTVSSFTDIDTLKRMHLLRPAGHIPFPPELELETHPFYVAHFTYPEKIRYNKKDITVQVYQDVLSGKELKFPKGFFTGSEGRINSLICLQYAINDSLVFQSIEELYDYFADQKRMQKFFKKYRLSAPLRDFFESPIDMLHAALPEEKTNECFFMKGKLTMALNEYFKE